VVGLPLPSPPPPIKTLFSDDFSGLFQHKLVVSGGSAVIDPNNGNPAPALDFPKGQTGFALQSAVNPFNTQAG